MPLSSAERAATRTILSYLSEEETVFLAETVSQRIVRAQTPREAEEIILEFSNDFEQLLKRQKMKREYLQRFILENRLPGSDAINAEKRILIRHILDFTGSKREITTVEAASALTTAAAITTTATTTTTTAASTRESRNNEAVDVNEMAPLFANWFYNMLNSFPKDRQSGRQLTATSGSSGSDASSSKSSDSENTFGPHHFIQNCCLNLRLESGGGGGESFQHDETVRGGAAVAEKLAHFCLNDELVFNVNLDGGGCAGKKSEHGLVMIQARGTLLRRGCLVGVFEQSFGLVKDPKQDNWKIQITNLALKTGATPSSLDHVRALT